MDNQYVVYLQRLKSYVEKIVNRAFYNEFTHCDETGFEITSIELVYYACKSIDDLPIVNVSARYWNKRISNEYQEIEFILDLNETFDYNAGKVFAIIDRVWNEI